MNILKKLSGMSKTIVTEARVEMTPEQFEFCKVALRRDNRGYNVQPNKFDMATPYRVAINYMNGWHNYGNFKSADVAAAIGSIISVAFFGENAKVGEYDEKKVDKNPEFVAWLADPRNADVIAKASGEAPSVHDGGELVKTEAQANVTGTDDNPF
jgi:hypothetical protein